MGTLRAAAHDGRLAATFGPRPSDFGDAFGREGDDRAYFDKFAGVGYAVGINALLYGTTY